MPPRRWIVHIDMDTFYASVEWLRHPELAGQPVVIGSWRRHQPVLQPVGTRRFATLGGYAGRGVVATATYPARDFGIGSGRGLMKAALKAPQAVLLPTDFERYRHYFRAFKAAVAEVAPLIEGPWHRRDLHRPDRGPGRAGQHRLQACALRFGASNGCLSAGSTGSLRAARSRQRMTLQGRRLVLAEAITPP